MEDKELERVESIDFDNPNDSTAPKTQDEEKSGADHEKSTSALEKTTSEKSIADSFSPIHEFFFVAVVCLMQFTTQAASSQPLSAIDILSRSFGITNPGVQSWLLASYTLTAGTFLLPAGRFGDVFGYKLMMMIGLGWFALWSLIAGLSVYSGSVLYIFARTFQGIGPAITLPNSLAILGATFPPSRKKAMYFGLFGAMAPNGSVVGSWSGAIFGQLSWWSWAYFSFAITLAIIGVVAYYVIPEPPTKMDSSSEWRETLKKLDLEGCIVFIAGLVLFNFAWNQAGVVGWQEAYVYVTLILGVACFPLFFWIEVSWATNPIIPFDAFNFDVSFVLICEVCAWQCFGIWLYYIWRFSEVIRGASPLLATAWVSPATVSGSLAAIASGFVFGKIRASVIMSFAMVMFTVGAVLVAVAPIHQTYWANIFLSVIIAPWGMDMSFPAGTLLVSDAMPKEHQGIAGGLITTIVNYSVSLGLGVAGTVDSHVNNGGRDINGILKGYRGALYYGTGIAGLGFALSLVYIFIDFRRKRNAS